MDESGYLLTRMMGRIRKARDLHGRQKIYYQREAVTSIHEVDSFHPKDNIVAPNALGLRKLCTLGTNVPVPHADAPFFHVNSLPAFFKEAFSLDRGDLNW